MQSMLGVKRKALQHRLGLVVRDMGSSLGHSQEGFADSLGLHRNYVGSIERGERNASLQNLEKRAQGLGMRLSDLLARAERLD